MERTIMYNSFSVTYFASSLSDEINLWIRRLEELDRHPKHIETKFNTTYCSHCTTYSALVVLEVDKK